MLRMSGLREFRLVADVSSADPSRLQPVLDPCCGSGTIIREARDAGLAAVGADLAAEAVESARANLRDGTPLVVADARALPFMPGCAGAVISNLPFGRRYQVDKPADWLQRAFSEFERVVAGGGAIVLLAPPSRAFERAVLRPRSALLRARHRIRLLAV